MSLTDRCRVCGKDSTFVFDGRLLDRTVHYFDCAHCGYLQTETPTWLDQAYASPINISDTGIIARNVLNTRRVGAVCLLLGTTKAKIVDFAGGHGILVRMLRDAGLEAEWSDKFCENLFARGFEHKGATADIATAFEAFEHFVEPVAELDRMFKVAPVVFLSTALLPEPVPLPGTWWYYGEEHGQHVGIYRRKTLEYLADAQGARLFSNDADIHVLARKPADIDLSRLRWAMRAWPLYRRFWMTPLTNADHAKISASILSKRTGVGS